MDENEIFAHKYEIYPEERTRRFSRGAVYERDSYHEHAQGSPWDFIIRAVCSGCGKTLSRYDNIRKFAFCYQCRSVLWPETVIPFKAFRKRSYSRN